MVSGTVDSIPKQFLQERFLVDRSCRVNDMLREIRVVQTHEINNLIFSHNCRANHPSITNNSFPIPTGINGYQQMRWFTTFWIVELHQVCPIYESIFCKILAQCFDQTGRVNSRPPNEKCSLFLVNVSLVRLEIDPSNSRSISCGMNSFP